MQAEIITIGDEILIGQITDTNSKWIAERLNEIGVSVYQITSIQDDKEHILKALAEAEANADIVIVTGGLGPTKDDITKHTLVNYFDDELVMYAEIAEHIKKLFAIIKYPYTASDLQQAMLPKKATILQNNQGTASGMWFEKSGKVFVSLPGVPNEMKGLMQNHVLPKLQNNFKLPYILHKTINTYGLGESKVAERIADWEDNLPKFMKLAFLPSYGKLRLRLSVNGWDKIAMESAIANEIEKLHLIIGDIIVDYDNGDTIEQIVHDLLTKNEQSLAVAESCTGGAIASLLTKMPGASKYFLGGMVTYSEKTKRELLKVSANAINNHTVVSKEVAEEMALNCKSIFKTDYAISVTGNAGPTTDNTDKTVGVVFIGVATPNDVIVKEFSFGTPREKVIEKAIIKSLELLRKEILKNNKNSLLDM